MGIFPKTIKGIGENKLPKKKSTEINLERFKNKYGKRNKTETSEITFLI